jgi:hypothetical protein
MLVGCGALRLNNACAAFIPNTILWENIRLHFWEGSEKILLRWILRRMIARLEGEENMSENGRVYRYRLNNL